MFHYTLHVNNKDIINIARRAFNLVDPRLIGHGSRVSYIVFRMLEAAGSLSPIQIRDLLILSTLHDIGAYKTEEIDRMVEFETGNIWNHSIYGYLFFQYFSPFKDMAPVILFHHAPWDLLKTLDNVSDDIKKYAQIISLADRFDIYFLEKDYTRLDNFKVFLERHRDTLFSSQVIDLFYRADLSFLARKPEVMAREHDLSEEMHVQFDGILEEIPFTEMEKDGILKMLTYAIDFRSPHTVTHTITTTVISMELAAMMYQDMDTINDVVCGAMIHDLGKIGIPVEILEFPGKLSPQAMTIMKTHVGLTAHILEDSVSPVIREIALRHHEKLNGSGYPKGLSGKDLTTSQRIVAVADIISALSGTRSYKDAFPKEKIVSIVTEMADNGLIDGAIVSLFVERYDTIMESVRKLSGPTLKTYQEMQDRYGDLLYKVKDLL